MSERRFLLALFVFALLLRGAFLFAYDLHAPVADWGDDADYDAIARHLVVAHHYGDHWFPPGYPLFLGLLYSLAGPSLAVARLVQAALGAATCCILYLIGRNLFQPTVGRLAGLLMAVFPGHIYMAWRLMSETLFVLLISLAVLAAMALRERGGLARAAALGLVLGASVLVKSNLLFLPPLLVLWLGVEAWSRRARRPSAAGWSRLARLAPLAAPAMVAAVCCAVALGVPLANAASSGGRFWPLAGNGGATLWWSNNPIADGYFVDPDATAAGRDFIARHGLTAAARTADPFERDRVDRRMALAWMRENPRAFLRLAARKLWNAYGPLPRAAVFERDPLARRMQLLSYGAILLPALGGLLWSLGRWRRYMIIYLVLASHAAMTVATYGTPRFTLAVVPYLLVFAAAALLAAVTLLQRHAASAPLPQVGRI